MNSELFFSKKRLSSYKDEAEHKANFRLMQALAPKLGILEIITRNMICDALYATGKEGILKPYAETYGGISDELYQIRPSAFGLRSSMRQKSITE